jgi:hypothetical protein
VTAKHARSASCPVNRRERMVPTLGFPFGPVKNRI